MPKCRYGGGVCAGEGGRGRSVPAQGTAGEGGSLVGRGTKNAPARGRRVSRAVAGFRRIQSGPKN